VTARPEDRAHSLSQTGNADLLLNPLADAIHERALPASNLVLRAYGSGEGNQLKLAQNRDPVADLHYLLQLVTDKDKRVAIGGKPAQGDKQIADLVRRQYCRWFVEDEQGSVAIQGLKNLHSLLLAHGQVPD